MGERRRPQFTARADDPAFGPVSASTDGPPVAVVGCPDCARMADRIAELEAELRRLHGAIEGQRDMCLTQAVTGPGPVREHTLAAALLDELLPVEKRVGEYDDAPSGREGD